MHPRQVQQQASELGQAALQVPLRVARMDALLAQLEGGDLKLRVRVLEAERAARRSGVMQVATLNAVGSIGLMNLGTTLALQGGGGGAAAGAAALCMGLSAAFGVMLLLSFKRIQRLDKFEKDIRG